MVAARRCWGPDFVIKAQLQAGVSTMDAGSLNDFSASGWGNETQGLEFAGLGFRFNGLSLFQKQLIHKRYVKSGGHAIAGKIAQRLKDEVNPYLVEVSLHGATAATHERQTRVDGSFDRLMKIIAEMKSLGLRVSLVSTLTSWNEHQVQDMFLLAGELGLNLRFQGPVAPKDNGDQEPLTIQPSANGWIQFEQVFRQSPQYRERLSAAGTTAPTESAAVKSTTDLHCGVGSDGFLVDPFGNVFPCLQLRRSAGNIRHTGIETIWTRSKVFPEARTLSQDTATRIALEGKLSSMGAPLFCPGPELKGCATSCQGCGSS